MPQHRLPPEIACMVLHYLHDDPKALKKCCLVHKSWSRVAQQLLFSECSVRIGVLHDTRYFPLDKKGGKRSPSEFIARIVKSPYLAKDIHAVRINIADMHRIITNSQGHDAWTLANLLAPLTDTKVDKLETIAFFSMEHLTDIYYHNVFFPVILSPEPLLMDHFRSVTRLDLHSYLRFSNLCTILNLLCSLPALVEFIFYPAIQINDCFEPPNPPTNLTLHKLIYETNGTNAYSSFFEPLVTWLAKTGTRHSLQYIAVHPRGDVAQFQPLLGAVTKPFSMDISNADERK
jgi:hypothetical protein